LFVGSVLLTAKLPKRLLLLNGIASADPFILPFAMNSTFLELQSRFFCCLTSYKPEPQCDLTGTRDWLLPCHQLLF